MENNGYTEYIKGVWDTLYKTTLGTPMDMLKLPVSKHFGLTLEELEKNTELELNVKHTMVMFYNYYNVWNYEDNDEKHEAYETVVSNMLHYMR